MRMDLGVLGNDSRVHVDERALSLHHLPLRFLEEHAAGRIAPSWIRVGEKVSYVRLSERAKHRITNRMHQGVGVGMAFQTFGVRNVNAAQN